MAEPVKDVKKNNSISWEEVILLILGIIALLFVFIPRFFYEEDLNNTNTTSSLSQNKKNDFNLIQSYKNIFNEQNYREIDNNGNIKNIKKPSLLLQIRSKLSDMVNLISFIFFSVSIFLILLFSSIIYYNKFRRDLIIKIYNRKFETEEGIKTDLKIEDNNIKILENSNLEPDTNDLINPKWKIVEKYHNSANQSDWKLAIIEADIMLYEVLSKSGFIGESIGDMLKNTDKSKLSSLDDAWSAHKVRNQIAHSGTDYVLSKDLLDKTIEKYKKVFDELNFV